jgi:arylsulfatase A-like enzyme
MAVSKKVLLIGLDSATWRVIDPLLAAGQLPNLAQLMEDGAYGTMISDTYSASPVVWTTIATGKTPAKHGVEDFFSSQSQLRARRIWEILAEQGETVGIYQYLVTWPPKSLDGFVVPGWLALDEKTHPPELSFIKSFKSSEKDGTSSLADYLSNGRCAVRYGLRPRTAGLAAAYLLGRNSPAKERKFRAQRTDIALSTDYFCNLLDRYRPSFAATIYYQSDSAGHYYWHYFEPERYRDVPVEDVERYGQVLPQIYIDLDAAVGRLVKAAGDDYTVLVMSDHGMGPISHPSGYLYRPKLAALLEDMGYATDREHALIGIDFYLFLGDQDPQAAAVADLLVLVNGIVVEETSEQVFQACLIDEQYLLVQVKTARPELRDCTVCTPGGRIYAYTDLVSTNEKTTGTHEIEGIFIAAGPGIKQSQKLGQVRLVDVAPTILALTGRPVAEDMDGQVLVDALDDRFLAESPIRFIESYEDSGNGQADETVDLSVEEREYLEGHLRALGYME